MSPPHLQTYLYHHQAREGGSTYTTEDTKTQLMNILQLVEATRMHEQ